MNGSRVAIEVYYAAFGTECLYSKIVSRELVSSELYTVRCGIKSIELVRRSGFR